MILRKPMPVARSVHWEPVGWSEPGVRAPVMDVPLFITQGALREAMRHLRSDPDQELMGFLLGNLFECTNTGSRYVVMTSAMRTGHVITEEEPVQIPEEEWLGMQLELRRRRAGLMGWYHSGPFVGPHPARLDLDTHRERFHEPWQTGLVIATEGPQPTGGFFRLTPNDPNGGGMYIPFDELVDDEGLLPGGRRRTLIDWSNYRTDQDVEADRTERRPYTPPPAASRRPSPPRGAPGVGAGAPGATPGGPPGEQPPGPATLPVMLPEPADLEDTPAMPLADGRRTRRAILMMVLVGAAIAAGGYWWWNQRLGPEPPPGLSTDVLPAARARAPRAAAIPPVDTTGLGALGTSGTSGATTSVATAPAGGGTMTDTPGTGLVPNAGVTAARPAPTSDPRVARFDTLADSVEQAIRNFGTRRSDFAVKRLSCDGLGAGYRGADDAYMALAGARRDARTGIDAGRDARFRRLSAAMDQVNTVFDSTKCPRP